MRGSRSKITATTNEAKERGRQKKKRKKKEKEKKRRTKKKMKRGANMKCMWSLSIFDCRFHAKSHLMGGVQSLHLVYPPWSLHLLFRLQSSTDASMPKSHLMSVVPSRHWVIVHNPRLPVSCPNHTLWTLHLFIYLVVVHKLWPRFRAWITPHGNCIMYSFSHCP